MAQIFSNSHLKLAKIQSILSQKIQYNSSHVASFKIILLTRL